MKKIIEQIEKKYNLNLGEKTFSPVTKISAALIFEYSKLVQEKKDINLFFLCFPEKASSSLWISIILLINYFEDDYLISNNDANIELKTGMLIDIFGSVVQYEGIEVIKHKGVKKDMLKIKTKNDNIFFVDKSNIKTIKNTQKKNINTPDHFIKSRNSAKSNRNCISKILLPNSTEIINDQVLDSKILLITGRGNTKKIRNILSETIVNGESLSKVFQESKNLIIKHDLETYKDVFSSDYANRFSKFVNKLFYLTENETNSEFIDKMKQLISIINSKSVITIDFNKLFLSIIDDFEESIPRLRYLLQIYPGVKECLPENIKAVIVNDINQLESYRETIDHFIQNGIPVIFVSNRNPVNVKELNFYETLFKRNPEYYRVNWNKIKLLELAKTQVDDEVIIDKKLWNICKRYSKQSIEMSIFPGNELDMIIPVLQKEIKDLEGFDKLQKAYYKYFNPVIYSIKNSLNCSEYLEELLNIFKSEFDKVKNFGFSSNAYSIIEQSIIIVNNLLENNIIKKSNNVNSFENTLKLATNSKKIDIEDNIYSNLSITSINKMLFIPNDIQKNNIPSEEYDDIVFSGFPYNEISGHYLTNSVCKYYVPNIKVLCWPCEAELTTKYIYRRLKGGYFIEKFPSLNLMNNKYLLKDNEQFSDEINSFLTITGNGSITSDSDYDQEESLEKLNQFKYKGYSVEHSDNSYITKCDIINFADGSFMFLPNNSKILSEIETFDGKHKIKSAVFNELNVGMRIYKYKKDRAAYKEISEFDNNVNKATIDLGIWKDALDNLFIASNKNLSSLESVLMMCKKNYLLSDGNPTRLNLQRWLFDEDIIAPDRGNLRIILQAAQFEDVENMLNKLSEAYSVVNSFRIHLSSSIKKKIREFPIKEQDNISNFKIVFKDVEIDVESRIINALEKSDIEIEYHNTRKIINE